MDYKLDAHCTRIFFQYLQGLLSYEEAEMMMRVHGDRILADILANGFSGLVYMNPQDWSGVRGSNGSA